jgi:hypothetical protein
MGHYSVISPKVPLAKTANVKFELVNQALVSLPLKGCVMAEVATKELIGA